jgi:hypothetical protein
VARGALQIVLDQLLVVRVHRASLLNPFRAAPAARFR